MAKNLERLLLRIEADTSRLRAQLGIAERKAQQSGTRMGRAFNRAGRALDSFGRKVLNVRSAVAALAGAAALGALVKQAIDFADNIGKTSKAVGLSAEALQELRFAARRSGLEVEQLDRGLIKFIKSVAELKTRTSSELNLALKDFNSELVDGLKNSKSQEEALRLIADAIKNASSETERAAIASAAFGRVGPLLVTMFRDGSAGIDDFARAARNLNAVLSNEMVAASEVAADAIGDAADALRIAGTRAALAAVPAMTDLARVFTDPEFIGGVRDVSEAIKDLIEYVVKNHKTVISVFSALGAAAVTPLPLPFKAAAGLAAGATTAFNLQDEIDQAKQLRSAAEASLKVFSALRAIGGPFAGPEMNADIRDLEQTIDSLNAKIEKLRNNASAAKSAARDAGGGPSAAAVGGGTGGIDLEAGKRARALSAKIEELHFKVRVLRGDFDDLAEGAPQLARQLGLLEGGVRRWKDGTVALSPELERLNEAMREIEGAQAAVDVIERTRTEEEKMAEATARLNALKPELIRQLGSEAAADETIRRALEQLKGTAEQMSQVAQELGFTFSSAFEEAIVQGKGLSEVLQGIEQDILRILVRKTISEPVSGFFGSLFEGLGSSFFGGTTGSSHGNVFQGGRVVPFRRGGIPAVGNEPTAFRMANGGLGTLREGRQFEAILPLARIGGDLGVKAAVGGGPVVNVRIVNNTGAAVQQREFRRGDGGRDLEVVVGELVARDISRGGPAHRAIRDTFAAPISIVGR
jgi:prefoldin subunit 5